MRIVEQVKGTHLMAWGKVRGMGLFENLLETQCSR